MSSSSSTNGDVEDRTAAIRSVEAALRTASRRLRGDASPADIMAALAVIDEAERSLAELTNDPWEPELQPLRAARDILGSHLLAASACATAEVAAPITARVLRRGAESAHGLLANHSPRESVDAAG